jgi:hypothetical protein
MLTLFRSNAIDCGRHARLARFFNVLVYMVHIVYPTSGANFGLMYLTDAVPKKRGPKTDVLEALLKRVDGLERRLKDEKKSHSPSNESGPCAQDDNSNGDTPQPPQLNTNVSNTAEESAVYSPTPTRQVVKCNNFIYRS